MKPMVLCVTRKTLTEQSIPVNGSDQLHDINLDQISPAYYHFVNRSLVDSLEEDCIANAQTIPQVLPYIAVINEDGEYLTYSRNGQETRLHGSRSLGIGGHIDISDMVISENNLLPLTTIRNAASRELIEELGLTNNELLVEEFNLIDNAKAIVDFSNNVGKVHLGIFNTISINKSDITGSEELNDPMWLTIEQLKQDIEQYESWSRIIINSLK